LKFLPGREVLVQGTLEIRDRAAAARSPLAVSLFNVGGVTALLFGPDYIDVTKQGGEWKHLKPAILGVIMTHFMSGAPVLESSGPAGEPGSEPTDERAAKIRAALRQVIDPELGYNIVDLGLVYDVKVSDDGVASVTMTTTTPGCPATNYLSEGARECTASVEGVAVAEISLTYEPRWSPELMSEAAKIHLGISSGGYQ
jgi:metal-sulfur cluster biosynthetic enzyme